MESSTLKIKNDILPFEWRIRFLTVLCHRRHCRLDAPWSDMLTNCDSTSDTKRQAGIRDIPWLVRLDSSKSFLIRTIRFVGISSLWHGNFAGSNFFRCIHALFLERSETFDGIHAPILRIAIPLAQLVIYSCHAKITSYNNTMYSYISSKVRVTAMPQ